MKSNQHLREELEAYCTNMLNALINTSDIVEAGSDDLTLRRMLLTWRIGTFRDVRRILDTPDPRVGLIDLWAMSLQRRDFLNGELALELLGAGRPAFSAMGEAVAQKIGELAEEFFEPETLNTVRDGVHVFAAKHPITNAGRPPLRVSVAVDTGESVPWFSKQFGAAQIAGEIELIAREMDQLTWMMSWMATVVRWETRIMLLDLGRNPRVAGVMDAVIRTADTLDSLDGTIKEMPSLVRAELTTTLDQFDKKQGETQKTIRELTRTIEATRETMAKVGETVEKAQKVIDSDPALLASVERTSKSLTGLSTSLEATLKVARGLMADAKGGEATRETAEGGSEEAAATAPGAYPEAAKDEGDADEPAAAQADQPAAVERTSRELTASTQAIHASLVELRGLIQSDDLGRLREEYAGTVSDMVDHIFWRALQFLVAAIVLIVGGVFLSRRLKTAGNAE